MYVKNGTSTLNRVLLCPPTYLKTAAPINEISKKYTGQALDENILNDEFAQIAAAYHSADIETEEQTPAPNMPNSIFARDFGGCVKEGYILGRFKKEIRYPERKAYEDKMKALGIPKLMEVTDGYFEGGDFAFLNETTIAIGTIDRTDEIGFNEIKTQLEPLGYRVVRVNADSRYLHLDMCFNLVDDHLAVAYKNGLPQEFLDLLTELQINIIPVEEQAIFEHGCNLEALGNHRVLSLKQNKYVNSELRKYGMHVIELNITETLKAGGGPHCMTFPLSRF